MTGKPISPPLGVTVASHVHLCPRAAPPPPPREPSGGRELGHRCVWDLRRTVFGQEDRGTGWASKVAVFAGWRFGGNLEVGEDPSLLTYSSSYRPV